MCSAKRRKIHLIDADFEPPEEKIVSDGDIIIKELHKKQVNTKTSVSEQLAYNKEFTKSVDFIPFTNYSHGSKTLQDVQLLEKQSEETSYLQSLGIPQYDIKMFLDYKQHGIDNLKANHKLLSLDKMMKTIEHIECHLEERTAKTASDLQSSSREISRHKMESLAIKPDSVETKLLKFVLESKPASSGQLYHPMNDIVDIEHEFMANVNGGNTIVPVNKMQKKARNLANRVKRVEEEPILECPKTAINKNKSRVKFSKWDLKEKVKESPGVRKEKKLYSCKPQNLYTITDGKIVLLNDPNNLRVAENGENKEAAQKKLTIEEIKQLPKFQNYETGEVSKVLYVKNLGNHTSEEDLRSLLGNFSSSIISIRVMQGRMKGQAFIEFMSEQSAENALKEINGVSLSGKPIVIQFGKGASKTHMPSDIG